MVAAAAFSDMSVSRDHTPESTDCTDHDHDHDSAPVSLPVYFDAPTCGYCGCWVNPYKTVEGSYCSEGCYYRDQGASALKNLETDHKFCRSCMAKVKQIERPPEKFDDYIVGYQYGTPAAVSATREYESDDRATPLIKQRIGCECGATDLSTFDSVAANADREQLLVNLIAALREKYREEKLDELVDRRELFDAYRESGGDIEYAVGRGLYA